MTVLVKATKALKPRTKESRKMALLYAAILVLFAVSQLFTFDEFITLIPELNLPLGPILTYMLAPLIVVAEVFALPFLLGMSVSIAFRWLSMFFSWFVAGIWLILSLWTVLTNQAVTTIGFFGTVLDAAPGWWAIFLSLALCILAAWTGWGLWPGKRR